MKKHIIVPFLFIICTILQSTVSSQSLLLSGKIENTDQNTITIYRFDSSFIHKINLDREGNFSDSFQVDRPGFFTFIVGKTYFNLFLQNGFNLKMSFDAIDYINSARYEGIGSKINNYATSLNKLKSELIGDNKVYFIESAEDFIKKNNGYKKTLYDDLEKSGLNNEEYGFMRKMIDYNCLLIRNNYRKFYVFNTKKEPYIPDNYYDPIRAVDMNDVIAYNNSMDYRYLIIDKWRIAVSDAQKIDSNLSAIQITEEFIQPIKYEPIRDQIVRMLFNKVDPRNSDYEMDYLQIVKLVRLEKSKINLNNRLASARATEMGKTTATFTYENFNGGTTSLASLRGKYVYIDIWATWCGPCLREFPELKKLIEDFQGNNIEFVCISIDKLEEIEKWKKLVKEKNLGGIQLISDKELNSDFMKYFQVSLIPRNILINPEGKIISSAGLRPSDPKTREILNSILIRKVQL